MPRRRPDRDRPRHHRKRPRSLAPVLVAAIAVACGGSPPPAARPPERVTISVVGTNDLHGHVRALPILGGYLANLRAARAADGGALVLLDGGDLFQGTLESNLEEGASVVAAYEALGYDAATIGNHEFDYGPVGPRATARDASEDPRGALRARIAEASFPFLGANLIARETGAHAGLGVPSVLLERAGVRVGLIGVTTEQTLTTTIAPNVADLAIRPLADAIAEEARALRARGAAIVLVAAHAGGHCDRFEDPDDLSSCDDDEEIFEVARALPVGAVDAIVAGHTHQGVAHRVNGIAIVESYSYGVAFGRVDLIVERQSGRLVEARVHPPQRLCADDTLDPEDGLAVCRPPAYEGAEVALDRRVADAIAPAIARADQHRDRPLGPVLLEPFDATRGRECALGNLFVDLMLRARPDADVAIINGGGLRADLPAGPLRYGALYEAFPFDNRFARVRMRARELASMIAANLARDGSFLSVAGVVARARCDAGAIAVTLTRGDGAPIPDDEALDVLASDFLATGGDGAFAAIREARPDAIRIEEDPPIREAMAEVLAQLSGEVVRPDAFYDPTRPRVHAPGDRPVQCH